MEAALLELLTAATGTRVVSTDALERVNDGERRIGQGEAKTLNAGGSPLLISLGHIREGIPARQLANCILKRPCLVALEAHQARGIGQGALEILAKVVVVHDHGIDQAALEGLADDIRQGLKPEEVDSHHPAAP